MHDILLSFGLIILAGVVFRRLRIGGLDADSLRQAINVSVFNLFLPALCIKIIYTTNIGIETILIPATAGLTIITAMILSIAIYTLLGKKVHIEQSEKGVLILAATFGNVTYLGLPVLTALYGHEAARYALFYDLLATTPLLWLVGASLASHYGEAKRLEITDSIKTIACLPPIWAILIGIALKSTNIQLPAFVETTLELLGGLVVPLMVFSIGLALSFPKVRHAYAIVPAVIIKLAIVPFISYMVARFLGLKGNALASCLMEGAMPTMILSLLFAARFKLDEQLSAFMIVITTAMSFITLPIAVHLTKLLVH